MVWDAVCPPALSFSRAADDHAMVGRGQILRRAIEFDLAGDLNNPHVHPKFLDMARVSMHDVDCSSYRPWSKLLT